MNYYAKTDAQLIEENSRWLTRRIQELEQSKSGHKRTEKSLWDSQRKYRSIAENTADLISILDMNLRFTYVSPASIRLRGFTVEEAMEQPLEQVLTPESLRLGIALFEEEMQLEASGTADPDRTRILELEEYKKDGSTIWMEINLSFLRDKDGKPVEILIVSRDITDRKRTEQEMAILADIRLLIASTLDIDEVYERFAAETQKLIPFDSLTVNLYNFQENTMCVAYVSGLDIDGRRQGDSLVLEGSLSEAVIRARIGLHIQAKSIDEIVGRFPRLTPIFQAGMRSIICVPLVSRDEVIGVLHFRSKKPNAYTEQDLRLAEKIGMQIAGAIANAQLFNDLSKTEKSLRKSEEKFRVLFENAKDGIFLLSSHGEIVSVNAAFAKMHGYTVEEMLTMDLKDLDSPESAQLAPSRLQRLFAEESLSFDVEHYCKNGQTIPLEVSANLVIIDNEKYILGFHRDITARKQAEEALRDSEKRYRELSIIDDLTQLCNSRHFYHQLKMEIGRADRYGHPLTMLLLDLDDFKAFNDAYGHVEGDQVLFRLGQVIKRCLRQTDSAYRYGGEEFTILLPMATSEDGAVTAERIRTEFKKETFSPALGQNVHMTVSIGLGQYKPREEMKRFIHRVDQLMYQGKKNGKDRVCCESYRIEG